MSFARRLGGLFSTLLVAFTVSGCISSSESGSTVSTRSDSQLVSSTTVVSDWVAYTETAISVLEVNYLWSDRIDWDAIAQQALVDIGAHPTGGATHQALVAAVTGLNDRHTYFVYPPGIVAPQRGPVDPSPFGRNLDGNIGYVSVPAFVGDEQESGQYATDVHRAMTFVSEQTPVCGWVVDLRFNSGGYVVPMLLGVGPLLGEGVAVRYRGTQRTISFEYRAPAVYINGALAPSRWGALGVEPFALTDPQAPIAVLTSNLTTSAGEGVLAAFIGRPSTRTFGTASAGLATDPTLFKLADDAALVITTDVAEDRLGRVYESVI